MERRPAERIGGVSNDAIFLPSVDHRAFDAVKSDSICAAGGLPVDAKGLANLMLDWAAADGLEVTPMKLQKLLYFCHADYVVQFGAPLLKQEFEAWDYGPVIPSVYAEFKGSEKQHITKRAQIFDPILLIKCSAICDLIPQEMERVHRLFQFYSGFSATKLSCLSHEVDGPWRQARALFSNGLNMDRRVTDDMIRRYHRVIHH